jgi:polar amino acid transport system permease protein
VDLGHLLPPLIQGSWVTVQLTIYSTVLGAACSFAFGIGKLSRSRIVRWLSVAYIEVFRGTSLLVQLFWLFFALPLLGEPLAHVAGAIVPGYHPDVGAWDEAFRFSPVTTGVLALALNIGAYGAEVVRGAIQAVPRDQYEAAVALNFTPPQTLWRVVLPQALVEMMLPFGNLAVQNLKDTALVSLITLSDLAFKAEQMRNLTQQSVPIYTVTLFLYFGMSLVLMAGMRFLERHVGAWARAGGR